MTKKFVISLLAFAFIASSATAYAADFPASPWTMRSSTSDQAWGKLHFGLKNFFLGWTEILTEPYEAAKEGNDWVSGVKGVGEGLFNGILDTVGGAVHLATFFCPNLDVPLPEGGTDIDKVLS